MVSYPKIALELLLLYAAFIIMQRQHIRGYNRFAAVFAGITMLLNLAFYYLAAWPLYLSYAQYANLSMPALHGMVLFDVVKWGVIAFVFSKLTRGLAERMPYGGFRMVAGKISWRGISRVILIGAAGGCAATLVMYGVSVLEHLAGYLDYYPWQYFSDNHALYMKLGMFGGIRNLAGEEILTRLGAQMILLYLLSPRNIAPVAAIILSALFFECWHNGFAELYFLNFSASVVMGAVYHKYGYESTAISHCVTDWLGIAILPALLS